MMNETGCCPPFDPTPWQGRIVEWSSRRFVKDRVFTLFYMPMNFGRVIRRLDAAIRSAGATIVDNMGLSDHTSKWNMDLYLAVDREIAGLNNVTLTGRFFCKVYDGPFNQTGQWCEDFHKSAAAAGHAIGKLYMWYTTCPKCAKHYGHNYVVIVGQLA